MGPEAFFEDRSSGARPSKKVTNSACREWTEFWSGRIFFRGRRQRISVLPQTEFFQCQNRKRAPSAGFTGKSGIFWLPPRHNKQRDPPERSDICCLGPCQAFKQKTSPLDADFLSCAASKLLTFHDFGGFFDFLAKIFNLKK
jgi:hypothetical protein